MGDMLIRNVPDALKFEIARKAKSADKSLSAAAIELLQKGLVTDRAQADQGINSSGWEALRSAFVAAGAVGDEFAQIMNEIEAERKRDFGGPPLDLE